MLKSKGLTTRGSVETRPDPGGKELPTAAVRDEEGFLLREAGDDCYAG